MGVLDPLGNDTGHGSRNREERNQRLSLSWSADIDTNEKEIFDMAIAGLEPGTSRSRGEVPNH